MPGWGLVLRRLNRTEPYDSATDTQLLLEFLQRQSAQAFEVIVRRHGGLVLRICQRELLNTTDAEDAFQATFLTLAQKAQFIRQEANLAGWLAGVARRLARRLAQQQRQRRQRLAALPSKSLTPHTDSTTGWWEEERRHLPQEYQTVIDLCLIQGLSRDEAALQLGQSPAAVHGLLYRARLKLKKQLVQRGTVAGSTLVATQATVSAVDRLAPFVAQAAVKLLQQGTTLTGLASPAVMALLPARSLPVWVAPAVVLSALVAGGIGWWGLNNLPPADHASLSSAVATLPVPALVPTTPAQPVQTFLPSNDLPESPFQNNAQQSLQQAVPLPQQQAEPQQPAQQQRGVNDAPNIPVPPADRIPSFGERSNLARQVMTAAGSMDEGMLPLLPHVSKQTVDGKPLIISVITSEQELRDCFEKAPKLQIPPNVQVMSDSVWDGSAFHTVWSREILIAVVLKERANGVTLTAMPDCWIAPDAQGVGHLLLNYAGPDPTAKNALFVQYPYVMLKVPRKDLKQIAVTVWRTGPKPDGVAEIPQPKP